MYKHHVLFKIPNPFHREGDFFSTLVKLSVTDNSHTNIINHKLFPRWKVELTLGRGAGYRNGRTLYLACNLFYPTAAREESHKHRWEHIGFGGKGRDYTVTHRWQAGFTRNANLVPYVDGM